jgi:hypothetical protein
MAAQVKKVWKSHYIGRTVTTKYCTHLCSTMLLLAKEFIRKEHLSIYIVEAQSAFIIYTYFSFYTLGVVFLLLLVFPLASNGFFTDYKLQARELGR